ncbi:MAG: TIGR01212 family radical SAM protein, partial [Caldiserica bacterium]|nr:TIGR01212 family radical SAM protein [Caldisericota bacterium]
MSRYYRFSRYLKEKFGCYVYKIGIDAGFSCPNRDGRLGNEGCIFCDNRAFSFHSCSPKSIEEQIKEGMEFGQKRYGAKKFMIYFQAYTNTYAPVESLKKKYDIVKNFPDIVGIAIGTRPDCVNEEILDLIESYATHYEVW